MSAGVSKSAQCRRVSVPGHRAWHICALGLYTRPKHSPGLLILHSSPCQGNEPREVAQGPHVTTMMDAHGREQRALEQAGCDQGWVSFNYRPSSGLLGALAAPQ